MAIVAGELATLMQMNETGVQKVMAFWAQPRLTQGAPLPRQDTHRDVYFAHAAQKPQELISFLNFGSIRSGKTDGVIALYTELMEKFPGTRALASRRTLSEIYNSLFDSIEKFYAKWEIEYSTRRGDSPRIYLPNGSVWVFIPTEKSDKQKENKADTLGGSEFALALLEEANEIKDGFYDTVVGRMSQRILPAPMITLIENPPDEGHWTYKKLVEKRPTNHYNLHFPLEDNRINLGDEYVDDIIERYKDSPTLYRKFYLGLFTPTIIGEPIFGARFNKKLHIADSPLNYDPDLPMDVWYDHGFRRPACVAFQDDPETGQLRVFKAILGKDETTDVFASRTKSLLRRQYPKITKWRLGGDVAGRKRSSTGPKSELDILEAVWGQPVESQYSKIEYGISLINEQLSTLLPGGKAALVFCPAGAKLLIEAFEFGYTQDPDAKGDDVLKPCKDQYYEHCTDALRYGVCARRSLTTQKVPKNADRKLWRHVKDGLFQEGYTPRPERNAYASYSFGKRRKD